jgi:predicted enzyme related to lactoylglutathione lyase
MPNLISHIEIAGPNGDKLRDFYAGLFGWAIENKKEHGFDYGRFVPPFSETVTGGLRYEPDGKAEVVLYVSVEDLEETVKLAEALGGSVRVPPMDGAGSRFALVQDPDGNPVGLVQA